MIDTNNVIHPGSSIFGLRWRCEFFLQLSRHQRSKKISVWPPSRSDTMATAENITGKNREKFNELNFS